MTTAVAIPFVDLQRQHRPIVRPIEDAIERVMGSSAFTLGEEVHAFEREFASFCAAAHAVGVGSGTDALHLALRGYGIGPGDEVITAVNTFAATAEAILMCGATPVFVDIDEKTYLIDPAKVAVAITPRTRAIIPVHLYGQPADMDALLSLSRGGAIKIIEDACQSHGARSDGRPVGSMGDAGCFSFYPSKNLGAMGDGGIVVTDDRALADEIRLLRNHGEDDDRLHVRAGFCSRLHGMQAAILRAKLPSLPEWNAQRMATAGWYEEALSSSSVMLPTARRGATHVYHLYVIQSEGRDQLRAALNETGVATGVHYAVPLHLEPAYASLGYQQGDFPMAEQAARRVLSLPMYPYLERSEIEVIAGAIADYRSR